MGESCKEPDWEAEYKRELAESRVLEEFKLSLIKFIGIVHPYQGRRDGHNFLAELLGTVEIDILQRNARMDMLSAKIEGKQKP